MPSASASPREELLKIQKRIFLRNNDLIRSQAIVREKNFEKYEADYRRRVRDYERVSSLEELVEAVLENDVIYLGDYHTNRQSQRTLLRLLKALKPKAPMLALGVELVQHKHQRHLDDYLAENISEEMFLKRIQFRKNWYFDLWPNFKPIFDFAAFHRLPVHAIEWSLGGRAPLEKRDEKTAGIICDLFKDEPDTKLIVFVGDLHVAPSHLPGRTQKKLRAAGMKKNDLIIYQNSESIYWKLAQDNVENHVEIVQVSPREYCIINTPPIVWQQSYLNWLEQEGDEIDYEDARDGLLELIRRIGEFLGLKVGEEIESLEVFTCGDLSFLRRLYEDGAFSKKEISRIKKQILDSESYCLPQHSCIYLANLSINHAAEEAAHYLKYLCSGPEAERDSVDAFYANILHEAAGFFGSKIINHKRKCFHEKEYRSLVHYLHSSKGSSRRRLEMEISLLILKHRELEKRDVSIRSSQYFKGRHDLFFGVTHGLGYMLGDRLYYALLEEKVSKDEMRDLFSDDVKEPGRAFALYRKLSRKVRGVKIPRRV